MYLIIPTMKDNTLIRPALTAFSVTLLSFAFVASTAPIHLSAQTDGSWKDDLSGNWGLADNWVDGAIADGVGATATFNTYNSEVGGNVTVTLDQNRSLTSLFFADRADNSRWIIAPATAGTPELLTLDGNTPTITVNTSRGGGVSNPIEGTHFNVPLLVENNGTGNFVINATLPSSGRWPVVVFNETVTSQRDLQLATSFGHVTFKENLQVTGDMTLTTGEGRIRLEGTDNTISGLLTLRSGSQLRVQSLSNNQAVTLGSGTLILMTAADIRLSSLSGNGTISAPDNAPNQNSTLRLNVASDTIQNINASMGWSWITFHKEGEGTAYLNNQWRPSKGAFVEEGTLVVNHANALVNPNSAFTTTVRSGAKLAVGEGITFTPTGPVVFENGSAFGGSGTYNRGSEWSVPDNFTIAPGLSIGTLTVDLGAASNFLWLKDNTTMAFELAAGGGGDQFFLLGELILSDSILSLSGDADLNVWYTIISAGSIVGTFGEVDPNYQVAYTATEVNVMLVPEPASAAVVLGLVACGLLLRRRRQSA